MPPVTQSFAFAGDDNLCNVPHATPCSPAKRCKENRGCRVLFGDPTASPGKQSAAGPAVLQRGQETPQGSGRSAGLSRSRLFRQEGGCGRRWDASLKPGAASARCPPSSPSFLPPLP